ncbi:MAG TPA: AMP-binding protein, partial [Verrucomicrobiae bacterium]|nr:AMP-binding protein [Verrucomicrobiae bacterium]
MGLALAAILAESAARHPERTALVFSGERTSYRELWEQARRYAGVLRARGARPGDRIAILMPNLPDFARAYYAILALGCVVVPVHALLTAEEVEYVLRDSGARTLLCAGALLAAGLPAARAAGVECLSV